MTEYEKRYYRMLAAEENTNPFVVLFLCAIVLVIVGILPMIGVNPKYGIYVSIISGLIALVIKYNMDVKKYWIIVHNKLN